MLYALRSGCSNFINVVYCWRSNTPLCHVVFKRWTTTGTLILQHSTCCGLCGLPGRTNFAYKRTLFWICHVGSIILTCHSVDFCNTLCSSTARLLCHRNGSNYSAEFRNLQTLHPHIYRGNKEYTHEKLQHADKNTENQRDTGVCPRRYGRRGEG